MFSYENLRQARKFSLRLDRGAGSMIVKVFSYAEDMAEFDWHECVVDNSKPPHIVISDGGAVIDEGNG